MVAESLRPAGSPRPPGLDIVPADPTLANYVRLPQLVPLWDWVLSSTVVVALAVPLTVLVASWAGFGIRLLAPRGRRRAVALVLALLLVPATAVWATRYELYRIAGVLDTYVPLVAPALAATTPFYVLVYVWSFGRVSDAQLGAARLEGASLWRTWRLVAMPQVRTATLAVAVLAFTAHWASFVDALLYVDRQVLYTVPLGLRLLQVLNPTDYPLLLAASVVATLPCVAAFLLAQQVLLDDPPCGSCAGRAREPAGTRARGSARRGTAGSRLRRSTGRQRRGRSRSGAVHAVRGPDGDRRLPVARRRLRAGQPRRRGGDDSRRQAGRPAGEARHRLRGRLAPGRLPGQLPQVRPVRGPGRPRAGAGAARRQRRHRRARLRRHRPGGFRYDGEELTCLPQNVSSLVVYYNADLFRRAGVPAPRRGWTWADFLAAAKVLTGGGTYGVGVEPSLIRVAPFVWSAGGEVVDDLTRPTTLALASPEARRGLDFFLDLRSRHGVTPPERDELSQGSEERFLSGRLGMYLDSRKAVPTMRDAADFAWDVAPVPVAPGGRPATILHGDAYCMAKGSPRADAAWRLVEYANTAAGQRILAESGRTVPSRPDVARSPAFLRPGTPPASSRVFVEAIPTIRAVPHTAAWSRVEEGLRELVEATRPLFGQGGA